MRRSRRVRAALAAGLALSATGCWSFMRGDPATIAPAARAPAAQEVILRVNEAGIAWSNGELGAEIQQGLLDAALFQRVHYPVEPVNPPDLVIEVQALGRFQEASVWGVVAMYATVYGMLVPSLFVPYFENYGLTCDVRLLRGSQVLSEFQIDTEATAVRAMFANPEEMVAKAKARVFPDLVRRIVDGVASAPRS